MSKLLDKEFFKQRAKTLAEMTNVVSPDSYLIERFFLDGTFTSTKIESVNGGWKRFDTVADLSVRERVLPDAGSLLHVLKDEIDALTIGPEITFISSPNLGITNLLEILVPIDPDFVPGEYSWAKLPVAKIWNQDWYGFEECEFKFVDSKWDPIEVLPSLVVVNGSHLVTIRSGTVANYLPLDPSMESQWPLITEELMLDFWYSCGEGPPSWEGRTSFGRSGPNFYARITSGDLDGEIQILPNSTSGTLVELLIDNVLKTYGGLEAFLLQEIGLPDLPGNPYEDWLRSRIEHEGHYLHLYLDTETRQKILSELETRTPRGKFLADSLRDSSTDLGRQIYEALPRVVETGSNWAIILNLRET